MKFVFSHSKRRKQHSFPKAFKIQEGVKAPLPSPSDAYGSEKFLRVKDRQK